MWSKSSQLRKRGGRNGYAEHDVVAVAHEDMSVGFVAPRDGDNLVPLTEQRMTAVSDFNPVIASVIRVVERGIKRRCRLIRSRIPNS